MAGKRWTQKEVEYLTKHYGKKGVEEIAEALGRTASAVQSKAPQLGLSAQNNLWTEEEEQFLKENYLSLGAEECARRLGRTASAVHGKIRLVGGGRPSIGPRVEWSEGELEFLRQNYQRLSWEEMQEQLGRTEQAIQVRASMLGLQRYVDPYPFFENWTEESAYVIGFFAADGWVNKRGPSSIRIGFAQKDADILYAIRNLLQTGDVYKHSNQDMHRYYVQSVKTYERLCAVFCQDVCQKSHTLKWPAIAKGYERHFLRGAVDGDGSWFQTQDPLWAFAYATSSKDFIDGLVETVLRETGIQLNVGQNAIGVWHARCTGIKAVCLADWLYRGANIALARKAKLAEEMKETSGRAYWSSITPKMQQVFPHILERYELMGNEPAFENTTWLDHYEEW